MNYVKVLIPLGLALAAVLFSFLIYKLNLKTNDRVKQFRFTPLALIYSVAACIMLSKIDRIMNSLFEWEPIKKLLDKFSLGGRLGYVVSLYIIILINLVLLLGFLIVKLIFRIGLKKRKIPGSLEELGGIRKIRWMFLGIFYNWEDKGCYPCRKWVKIEHTLRYAARIISAVYLLMLVFLQLPVFSAASWIPFDLMDSALDLMYVFPVLTLIPLNEFRWFLRGRDELDRSFGGAAFDRSDIEIVSDYSELAEQYKKQFPERFAACLTEGSADNSGIFQNDVKTDSPFIKAVAETLRERGHSISKDYIDCISRLTEGSNILCDASLYSEFSEYLFMYLNAVTAQGCNVLFLCPDEENVAEFKDHISEKFRQLNNYNPIWLLKGTDNVTEIHSYADSDTVVGTPHLVLDENVFNAQTAFFSRLSAVVLINASEMIAKAGYVLALLAHKLNKTMKKPQYICLSEGFQQETSNALRQILDISDKIHTCSSYNISQKTCVMLWNYEAARKQKDDNRITVAQDNLFGQNGPKTYWGVAFPIACVGMKYLVSSISIISRNGTPYQSICDSMKQNAGKLSDFFEREIGPSDFDSVLSLNRIDNSEPDSAFIVCEDDICNLPLALYNCLRFGGSETTMIHIISKPYMLRDFFAANAEGYLRNEAAISMIMPAFSDNKQIVITKLLCEASERGVELKKLRKMIQSIEPSVETEDDAVRYFRDVLYPEKSHESVERCFRFIEESSFDAKEVEFEYSDALRLRTREPVSKLSRNAVLAVMKLRDKKYPLNITRDMIYQSFVPSQNFVYNGHLYTVERINGEEGILEVKEAPDMLDAPVDFVQIRKYALMSSLSASESYPVPYEPVSGRISSGYEVLVFRNAHISVDTVGYFAFESQNPSIDLFNGTGARELRKDEREAAYREYTDANVISLIIKGIGSSRSDRTAFLLAVMLSEMMKTVFPYSHNCLAVCPLLNDPASVCNAELGEKIAMAYPQLSIGKHYYHDPSCVEVFMIEDQASQNGIARNLLGNGQFPFKVFFEAISAYLQWFMNFVDSGNISKKFLYFGGEKLPGCFDAETLAKISSELDTIRREGAVEVSCVSSKGQCSYCHRELIGVEYREMKDGTRGNNRRICRSCASLIVKKEDELLKLYDKVRRYLCGTFGITLPEDINVRFASAEKIRERKKTGDQREVLGFADFGSRELWVEADAPRTNVLSVLAHELTHFWQYGSINMGIDLKYIEGHASYVEQQFLQHEHYYGLAEWKKNELSARTDEYGEGWRWLDTELDQRLDYNSFSFMYEKFGIGGSIPPGGFPAVGKPLGKGSSKGKKKNNGSSLTGRDVKTGITGDKGDTGDTGEAWHTEGDPESGPKLRDPSKLKYYCYEQLDDTEKVLYSRIKEQAEIFGKELILDPPAFSIEQVRKVYRYVSLDHPELFWLSLEYKYWHDPSNLVTRIELAYFMPKEEAERRRREIEAAAENYLDLIDDDMSDFAAVKKIYEEMITLVDYDTVHLAEVKKDAEKNNGSDDIYHMYGVLVNHKAVCAGYARTTTYLLHRLGIEAVYVSGTTENREDSDGHAWNLISLEGEYYWLDTTWGDLSRTDPSISREGIYYDYFCVNDSILMINHKPGGDIPLPKVTATACNYHHRFGLWFDSYSYSDISKGVCAMAASGETHISLRFSSRKLCEEARSRLRDSDVNKLLEDIRKNTRIKPRTYTTSCEEKTCIFMINLVF
ncbi:Transglutaminase-like domain-containing protein [Ruminococcaceae bacterium FB2012]|nr:Transglutaminase-like domain-containing protein [Ruminococcaceae bacterium FB2012]